MELFFLNFNFPTLQKRRNKFAKIKLRKRVFILLSHKLELVSKFNSFRAYSLEFLNIFLSFSLEKKN